MLCFLFVCSIPNTTLLWVAVLESDSRILKADSCVALYNPTAMLGDYEKVYFFACALEEADLCVV